MSGWGERADAAGGGGPGPCPECGAGVEAGATRCPDCGAIFPAEAGHRVRRSERTVARPPRFDAATLVLILLLGGALVLIWLMNRAP